LLALATPCLGSDGTASPFCTTHSGTPPASPRTGDSGALVEYRGMRILFYTGNNPEVFAHNAAAAGVDLGHLNFAIVSHRLSS